MISAEQIDDKLRRLLDLQPDGQVFLVRCPAEWFQSILSDVPHIDGKTLLGETSITRALASADPSLPLRVVFESEDIDDQGCRALNQQREQLKRDGSTVLCVPMESLTTIQRHAPDLWKWAAHVFAWSTQDKPLTAIVHRGDLLDEHPYAPAPSRKVQSPSHALSDPKLERSPDE